MSTSSENSNSFDSYESDSSSENGVAVSLNYDEQNNAFLGFDESIEPRANEDEWQAYVDAFTLEQEQQLEYQKRFDAQVEVQSWCECSHCSMDLVVNTSECLCCQEIDEVKQKMVEVNLESTCLTQHPGFNSVCLDRWVLHTAGVGLKTKSNKSYQALFNEGKKSESEYLRAVAYRQIVRLLWNCLGSSNRTPLPACVYHKIRSEFPSDDNNYKGFEEDDDDENDNEEQN